MTKGQLAEYYYDLKKKYYTDTEDKYPVVTLGFLWEDFWRNLNLGSIHLIWEEDQKNIDRMEDMASRVGFKEFKL